MREKKDRAGIPPHVAVVGATGAAGTEMLRILEERAFPLASLRPIASPRSKGKTVRFRGEDIPVIVIDEKAFDGIDLAVFDTPDEVALEWVPKVARRAVVVDKSAVFRLRKDVPLVVPEVNPAAAEEHDGIIASPNCTMMTLLMPLAALDRAFDVRRVVASSYQSVSGAGVAGIDDLLEQLEKALPQREALRNGEIDVPPPRAFRHPIAFNVIPHVGGFDDEGGTSEERRIAQETQKILGKEIDIFATAVRVPTLYGHGVSAWCEFKRKPSVDEARAVLEAAAGVELEDDPSKARYPTALLASGKDAAYVGRIRLDQANARALAFFSTCDNLRKGAALNAVQIAELLVERGLL